jgi:hypothetical protein
MKYLLEFAMTILAGFMMWGSTASSKPPHQLSQTPNAREPVVVELFTSEGCSSCPPADALLAHLDSQKSVGSAEIIALEEHVDYWDQQGWKDPFSSSGWTARQYGYSGALGNGNPFTPEMVVDGAAGFVGNRGAMALQEIAKAAERRKAKVEISEVSSQENKSALFKITVASTSDILSRDTPEVILAITESGLHSSVKAGENAGEELHHSPVLRELKVIGDLGKNTQEAFTAQHAVRIDSKWNRENLRAIVFVQEKKSRHILGAAQIRLSH